MFLRFSRCAAVACAIALCGCGAPKHDPATAAKIFLALIEAGRTQEAY